MKIKTKKRSYEQVCAMERPKHRNPLCPSRVLQTLIRVLSILDMVPTRFTYKTRLATEELYKMKKQRTAKAET